MSDGRRVSEGTSAHDGRPDPTGAGRPSVSDAPLSHSARGEIPSFLVRRGRTGPTAFAAHARLWPLYGVERPYEGLVRDRPLVLEIGFGMGEATALMAAARPDLDLLAVDVHPAGVMSLLRRIEAAGLTNVRVIEGDAVEVLHALPEASLAELRVYFPDPWPKTRHAKRRLLRPSFAALVATRLAPQGFLHLATDQPAYVEHALLALQGWTVTVIDRPEHRPVTGYEWRARGGGREVTDLLARPGSAGPG